VEPNRDHPELPGPSIWPVGFAIGIATLLVGLIVSWLVAAVGAGLAIIFAVLWVGALGKGSRTKAPEAEAPLEPVAGEAAVLQHEPGERFPRSVFLEASTLGLGAIIGGIVTIPVIGFTIAPMFEDTGHPDVDLGPLRDFEEGQFVVAQFITDPKKGEVSRRTAYVRYNGLLENQPSFTIISNRCVHLGCPVQPNGPLFPEGTQKSGTTILVPTLPAGGFGCPCHGGQYDTEGNRTAGPPVRALDRYSYSIDNGHLILGTTFSVGEVKGTGKDAVIVKYGLRGPGQHTNNWQKWFYPLQPPH
jgi:quinol---cytochrome c reductase iron-sulfur subunit, bacillus type